MIDHASWESNLMDSKVDLIISKNVWKDKLKIMARFLSFSLLLKVWKSWREKPKRGAIYRTHSPLTKT